MDRLMVYPAALPLDTDILNSNKNAYVALGKLSEALFGTPTLLNGFACTPTSPTASLTVNVGPGEIYAFENVDNSAYGSLSGDSHQIVKQGVMWDTTNLTCPAPTTSGYSVNYLVEIAFSEVDSNPVVLNYYNAANPSMPYSGPSNSGAPNNTIRTNTASVSIVTGIAAPTGTQVTPSPDAGYIGAYVVEVSNGMSSITSGNITQLSGAPFLTMTIPEIIAELGTLSGGTSGITEAFADSRYEQIANMTTDVYTIGDTRYELQSNLTTDVETIGDARYEKQSSLTTDVEAIGDARYELQSNLTADVEAIGDARYLRSTDITLGSGYVSLPISGGGHYIQQWCTGFINGGGSPHNVSITFPTAFPTACLAAYVCMINGGGSNNYSVDTLSTTGCVIHSWHVTDCNLQILAIGH